jgi:hypothetical protein
VIPSTALGVVFVVAAFGPGYLYLRVAEQRSSRHERSGLVEAVELAVVGAFTSTVALLGVVALFDWCHVIDAHLFSARPHVYLAHHPLRILWILATVLAVAYGIAYVAARIVHRQPATIRAATAWSEGFGAARWSDKEVIVRATVELRDGRKIEGTLTGHSTEVAENRELLLTAPLRVEAAPGVTPETLSDSLMVLREVDILAVSGRFFPAAPAERPATWRKRLLGLGRRVLKRGDSN